MVYAHTLILTHAIKTNRHLQPDSPNWSQTNLAGKDTNIQMDMENELKYTKNVFAINFESPLMDLTQFPCSFACYINQKKD